MRTRIVGLLLSCFVLCGTTFGAIGLVDHTIWEGLSTTTDLPTLITFMQSPTAEPDLVRQLTEASWGSIDQDNYVSKMTGWITPPVTGEYTLYISGDDHCALYLSTDDTAPEITTDGYICYMDGASGYQDWYNQSNQASAPVTLVAGQYYAFIAIHREGTGGDHQSIGWKIPGTDDPQVITSDYIRNNGNMAGETEPMDEAVDVKSAVLSWFPPVLVEAATYNVSIYADPNIDYTGLTATELDLGNIGNENLLQYNTEYKWRIDAVEADGVTVHKGVPTTFTTNDGRPDFTIQPQDIQFDPGEQAINTALADSIDPSVITYEWFKVGDVEDESKGVGTELIINDVTMDDKGDYYCVATNDLGSETSNIITLFVTRGLVHRYSFTDDPNDLVGDADGTIIAPNNNVNIVNGRVVFTNNSIYSSNSGQIGYINLPNGMISDLGKQFTFVVWFTWQGPETQDWERVFDFGISNGGEDQSSGAGNANYMILTPRSGGTGNPMRFGFTNNELGLGEKVCDWSGPAPINTELCVAITWNEFTNQVKMFVDGVKVSENILHVTLDEIDDVNNWLGRAQWDDRGYTGSINEFRMYDEELSAGWINEQYLAGPDEFPADACADPPAADFDGDCKVDMSDFSAFAAEWLDCGLLSCQ